MNLVHKTSGVKSRAYRALEILPGVLTWVTLLGIFILSYFVPFWAAIYIILFDLWWVLKAINTAMHLLSSFFKLKLHARYDWLFRLEQLGNLPDYKQMLRQEILAAKTRRLRNNLKEELFRLDSIDLTKRDLDYKKIYHLVLLPTYKESLEVLDNSIRSILDSNFSKDRIFFVLATEERDYELARENSEILEERYGDKFLCFETIMHPDGILGEAKTKGANITYAARRATEMFKQMNIPVENVLVSAFDSDTVVAKNYFAYLTYAFLTAEFPFRTSYQPLPVYNNNIWDAPAITRIVAVANSFWQMVEASRPDRLVTFSSHAMSLRALIDVDYWPVNAISDDSQIFWRCWLKYHGDYRTVPIFTTVSLDAMLDETYWKTLVGQYKQKRRWAWGIENFPYLVTNVAKDKLIPFWKKFLYIERMLEGFYFWATASIVIAVLGWMPLLLGGARFEEGVFAANLPILTRSMMQIATVFLIFSVYINLVLLPPRPRAYSRWRSLSMVLQWVFVPVVSTIFGSAPAIDAQTRLMLGKYMEFWVTPKTRKTEIKEAAQIFYDASKP